MSYLLLLIGFWLSFHTETQDYDLRYLYQNWRWQRWEAKTGSQVTYVPSTEFGNNYGIQFRKNNSFSVCRGISYYPQSINFEFEVIEGKWKIEEDSIISLYYSINNSSYEKELIVRKLDSDELIVHFVEDY